MLAVLAPGIEAAEWQAAWRELARWLVRPQCRRVIVVCGPPGAGKSTWIARQRDRGAVVFEAVWADPRARSQLAARIHLAGKVPVLVYVKTARWVCLRRRPGLEERVREASRSFALQPPTVAEGWRRVHVVEHGAGSGIWLAGEGGVA